MAEVRLIPQKAYQSVTPGARTKASVAVIDQLRRSLLLSMVRHNVAQEFKFGADVRLRNVARVYGVVFCRGQSEQQSCREIFSSRGGASRYVFAVKTQWAVF